MALLKALERAAVVYDCVANFQAHPDAPPASPTPSGPLLAAAQLVVCDSDFLYEQKTRSASARRPAAPGRGPGGVSSRPGPRRDALAGLLRHLGARLRPGLPDGAMRRRAAKVTISGFLRAPPPQRSPHQAPGTDPRAELVQRLESFDGFLLPHRVNEFIEGRHPRQRSTSAWPWDGRSSPPAAFPRAVRRKGA